MTLPATRTLEAFVAAARLGSLATAAGSVAMSVPALSRRIAGLERTLGVRLLERVPRGVVLTEAGRLYLGHAAAVLERLRAAGDELSSDPRVVRVTTIPAFATRWLLPRLPAFRRLHPGTEVDVRTSTAFERLDAPGFDFAIRMARDCGKGEAVLLPIHLAPVWSAELPGSIESPADVLRHPLLGPDHRPEFWPEWLREAGLPEPTSPPRDVDPLLLYELALNGAGVAIGLRPLTSRLIAEGRLRSMPSPLVRSTRSFFLLENSGTRTAAARAFGRWLREEAQAP